MDYESESDMYESELVDLDRVTDRAWRRFRHELADRMSDLAPGELVQVTGESLLNEPGSGWAPQVEFRREADVLLGRVAGDSLNAEPGVAKKARRRLVAIGWSKRRSQGVVEFVAGVELSHTDQLAAMAVAALRDVFGVTHPAFLRGDVGIGEDPDLPFSESGCVMDEPLAVWAAGRERLDELVDQALTRVLGSVPDRDADGDIGVISGTAVVFVSTLPSATATRVWAELVVHVLDLDRARFEIEVLNRQHPFTKFRLVGDRIVAEMHLPASPFVPDHLRETVTLMCTLADEVDDDLAVRVSGRRFLESADAEDGGSPADVHDEAEDDAHPAMMTLLQLDADRPGSISPAMAAHICDYDQNRLLRLIISEEEQEIEWLKARDEARGADDAQELAAVCEDSRAHAERTVKLLRKALRYVIDRELRRLSG